MKRTTAIELLGGAQEAARWLGYHRNSISNWAVDRQGNLIGRRVCDTVLAALVRKYAAERLSKGESLDPRELELLDLDLYVASAALQANA